MQIIVLLKKVKNTQIAEKICHGKEYILKDAIKYLTFLDLIFIVMLMLSGLLSGIAGQVIYYFAFIIPTAIACSISPKMKSAREENAGVREESADLFKMNKRDVKLLAPIVFPTVTIIFVTSLLTSVILSALGFSGNVVEIKSFGEMLLLNAFVPAVFEELLFRYVPMKLLAPYSSRACVLISSLYFALIHGNLFQIPYAFIAGAILISVSLAFNSVIPSIVIHLVNNTMSIVWMKYAVGWQGQAVFVGILAVLFCISCVCMYIYREKYKDKIHEILKKGEPIELNYAPLALIIPTVYIAVANLFM